MKYLQAVRNKSAALLAVCLMAMVSLPAAAAVDVTAVTTEIAAAAIPIAAIGAAVLLILVGIKVYQWVRRAM